MVNLVSNNEKQITTTVKCHFMPTGHAKIKESMTISTVSDI